VTSPFYFAQTERFLKKKKKCQKKIQEKQSKRLIHGEGFLYRVKPIADPGVDSQSYLKSNPNLYFKTSQYSIINRVDGYFLCGEEYLTLPSNWKIVQLIDSIANKHLRDVFCDKTQREKSRGWGVLAKFTTLL